MNPRLTELMSKTKRGRPPAPMVVSIAISSIPSHLPSDCVDAVSMTWGWEGFVSSAAPFLHLWPIEDVVAISADYGAEPERDGMLLVGSDGGGCAYGMDLATTKRTR